MFLYLILRCHRGWTSAPACVNKCHRKHTACGLSTPPPHKPQKLAVWMGPLDTEGFLGPITGGQELWEPGGRGEGGSRMGSSERGWRNTGWQSRVWERPVQRAWAGPSFGPFILFFWLPATPLCLGTPVHIPASSGDIPVFPPSLQSGCSHGPGSE